MKITGNNCLVTGASSGLGFAVSKLLAEKGAHTIMMCRDKEKGENTLNEIKRNAPNASLDLIICDLASINSIKNFICEFKDKYSRLDILFNNAAVMKQNRRITEDGFETMFQVNYLAPFIFMNIFLELLKNSVSPFIINIARPEYKVRLDMDDLQFSKKYNLWKSFFLTKLYLLFVGLEFSRRHANEGVTITMIDPASKPFKSDLGRDIPFLGWFKNLLSIPVDDAAKNILYHITSDEIKNKHRKVFRGKQEWPITEYWEDTSISKNLWSVTESLINDKWNS